MDESEDFLVLNGAVNNRPFTDLDLWISGWPERRRVLERVRPLLEARIADEPVPGFDLAARPAMALLELGQEGIQLESDGSFPIAVHDSLRDRVPEWVEHHSKDSVETLYRALSRGHLMQQRDLTITTATSADPLIEDPDVLINMVGCWLVSEEGFHTDVAEIAAALLLNGEPLNEVGLANDAYPAIAEYWTVLGDIVSLDAVYLSIRRWLAAASATGVIPDRWAESLRSKGSESFRPISEVARSCLTAMLRYRTLRHIPRHPPSKHALN